MNFYHSSVRQRIDHLFITAENLRDKFEKEAECALLLELAYSFEREFNQLTELVPGAVLSQSEASRHVSWMIHWLEQDRPKSCESDIRSLCERDLSDLEDAFNAWYTGPENFDPHLKGRVERLMAAGEFDSAVRRAFVALTDRLRTLFEGPPGLDGVKLVNQLFGGSVEHPALVALDQAQREGLMFHLQGLFRTYRNGYGHEDRDPVLFEAEAVVGAVNAALLLLERIASEAEASDSEA